MRSQLPGYPARATPPHDMVPRLLYFHGGPGFNGNPERQLLTAPFRQAGFDFRAWDEPSLLRPAGPGWTTTDPFGNLLEQAEKFLVANADGAPVVVMGHSFGAWPACHLAHHRPDLVARVMLIAPALDLAAADRNIFTFTMKDFAKHGDPLHKELRTVLDRFTGRFDENAEEGFRLVLQNPRFFGYYWHDESAMSAFLPLYSPPMFSLDIDGFLAVRRAVRPLVFAECAVPVQAVFGAEDAVVSRSAELVKLGQHFTSVTTHDIPGMGHYPHVEATASVLSGLGAMTGLVQGTTRRV